MRAKMPDRQGFVDRDDVRLHYEIYGDGPETIVFLAPWSITHARVYNIRRSCPISASAFAALPMTGAAAANPTGPRTWPHTR
jgi:hypothetical protein